MLRASIYIYDKSQSLIRKSLYLLIGLLPASCFATTLTGMADNITNTATDLSSDALKIAKAIGAIVFIGGILYLYRCNKLQQKEHTWRAIGVLLIGIALVCVPSLMSATKTQIGL